MGRAGVGAVAVSLPPIDATKDEGYAGGSRFWPRIEKMSEKIVLLDTQILKNGVII